MGLVRGIEFQNNVKILLIMIRRDRLEHQLLTGLSNRILKPEMIDFVLEWCSYSVACKSFEIRQTTQPVAALQTKLQALAKHINQLVLTPKRSWMVPFSMYRATLKFSIDTTLRMGYVAVVVARDGIEPPTPAFSGPPSNLLSGLESS